MFKYSLGLMIIIAFTEVYIILKMYGFL